MVSLAQSNMDICELFPAWCRETARKRRRLAMQNNHQVDDVRKQITYHNIAESSSAKKGMNKKVIFAEDDRNSVHEYDEGDGSKATWYQRSDFRKFQTDIQDAVSAFSSAGTRIRELDTHVYCLRGLENVLSARSIVRKKERQQVLKEAVLEKQRRLVGAKNIQNDIIIRAVSVLYSKYEVDAAIERGRMYQDIENYI
jgi:hypothetical protein